jgi:SAM-dependent methyltransferase
MSDGHDPRNSYDRVAAEYAQRFQDEMDDKPFDRDYLAQLVRLVSRLGPICDLGCGPGQIARYLHRLGADVLGVDLSPGMVAEATRLNPQIPFHQGDMRALPFPDRSWGGIAAFYTIIHIPPAEVVQVLAELRRVLRPGGVILLSFHIGDRTIHLDEWWQKPVSLDFFHFRPAEMEEHLKTAGFELLQTVVRQPDAAVEYPSQRAYLFARRPTD